jgi:hypothetical protein
LSDPLTLRAAAAILFVTALAWLARRRCPGLATTWAAYVIMLAPVSGVVLLGPPPAALARYFEDVARHRPVAPVARLGLVRAWRALGKLERARAEWEVLRQLDPALAGLVASRIGSS